MKVGIIGAGGLGGYLGGRMAQAGLDVTFIARGQTLDALRQSGLQVQSYKGDFTVDPAQATGDPSEVGPVDLVLFSVKSYDADSAMDLVRPMIGRETAVIPVLNGIEHIAKLQETVGTDYVLGGLSVVSAHKVAPGVVHHVADGGYQLEFGEWTGGVSARCEMIQATLSDTGLVVTASPKIMERMWWKLAAICGANVLAVMRGDVATVWGPETAAQVRIAVSEVVAVAAENGVHLASSLPDEIAGILDGVPSSYKPSLLVDLERGNRLEVAAMNGAIAHLGEEAGVDTPVNSFIYACLRPYADGSAQ